MVICAEEINNGSSSSVELKNVKAPLKPSEYIKNGKISKKDYLDMAQRIHKFIDSNGIAPNYVNSPLGKVGYQNTVYTYSKILNFYKSNKRHPMMRS